MCQERTKYVEIQTQGRREGKHRFQSCANHGPEKHYSY